MAFHARKTTAPTTAAMITSASGKATPTAIAGKASELEEAPVTLDAARRAALTLADGLVDSVAEAVAVNRGEELLDA